MKKLVLVVAVTAMVFGGLTSCKKCSTCKATGNATLPDVTGVETCGKTSVINDYESAFKTTYQAAGYTVTCGK